MELFPYALLRIGGDTFSKLDRLKLKKSLTLSRQYIEKLTDKEKAKNDLCDRLLDYIKTLKDAGDQNLLQNLRRDIFNNRKLKPRKLLEAKCILRDAQLSNRLAEYTSLLSVIASSPREAGPIYSEELAKVRDKLKLLIQSETLCKGLILSSNTLLERVSSYVSRDSGQMRKKEVQVEQSLIKYLSRIYAKTSPFSTFTNLTVADFQHGLEGKLEVAYKLKEGAEAVKSHIRLNNHLFKYLMDLLRNYRKAYLLLPLRPNPTINREADQYLFLTNANNIESFQRIPFNPVIELLHSLASQSNTGILFKDLIDALAEQVDAGLEELEQYIKQLIDAGFFEYYLGVSGTNPDWDLKLNSALKLMIENEIRGIETFSKALSRTRKVALRYGVANFHERKPLLNQAFDDLKAAFFEIHKAANLPEYERMTAQERLVWAQNKKDEEQKKKEEEKTDQSSEVEEPKELEVEMKEVEFKHFTSTRFQFKPEQIFYEDTTRELEVKLDEQSMIGLTSRLNQLLIQTAVFKPQEEERMKITAYFLKQYGASQKVKLLEFYESYFRDFKRPEKELQSAREKLRTEEKEATHASEDLPTNTLLEVPALKKRSDLLSKWNGMLSELLKDEVLKGKEVGLRLAHLKKVNKKLKVTPINKEKGFHGSFQQLYLEKNKNNESSELKMVLNGTFIGFGKMFSRFFHILNDSVLEKTRSENTSLVKKGTLFLEGTDASYFNANLHPPLMPYEIWMPGGHNNVSADHQLPITDFLLQYDQEYEELQLIYEPSGERAFVFNLGFQGSKGRSELFQLLELFTVSTTGYPQFLNKSINSVIDQNTPKDSPIRIYPRIVFESAIVLQRKSWHMSKGIVPIKENNEEDWIYLTRIMSWRDKYLIPREVFVTINPSRDTKQLSKEQAKKLTRDDYKPQYIDFDNPLLLHLFSKIMDKAPTGVKMQEMLPSSDQLLKVDGKPFVSEYVVQWKG